MYYIVYYTILCTILYYILLVLLFKQFRNFIQVIEEEADFKFLEAQDKKEVLEMFPEGKVSYTDFQPVAKEVILRSYRAKDDSDVSTISYLSSVALYTLNKGHFGRHQLSFCREVVRC